MAAEKLRDEIKVLQVSIRDLFKWKLVLTGSVTALGLGFTGSSIPNAYLSIGAVPLIVAYCDLLIRDCDLRIGVIATYLRTEQDNDYGKYENFLHLDEIVKIKWWALSHTAIKLSSYAACIFVLSLAIFQARLKIPSEDFSWVVLVVTSVVGIFVVNWTQQTYDKKYDALWQVSKRQSRTPSQSKSIS